MNFYDVFQLILFVGVLIALVPPLGSFIARVLSGKRNRFEIWIFKIIGTSDSQEMNWKEYSWALLIFNGLGFLIVFALQILQSKLPLNPENLPNVSWHSALNTAVSFVTNTNWQGYAGEVTLSYFTQMLGLTVQNFVSAATGIAVFAALTRGIVRRQSRTLGNFWEDLTRSTFYILLPLSFVFAIVLVGQGVVQNFSSYAVIETLEGPSQKIPMGPAASQIAIKQLGTNGGGFFNANSAFPFENPTPFSNFLQMLALLLIPAALTYTYGKWVQSQRQGWVIFGVMLGVWLVTLGGSIVSEYSFNPVLQESAALEGKETRFGVINTLIWSTATTVASNGSVNGMHSSLTPLAGGIALFNIMLGEVIFGGVGSGMYGILLFVLLTVFLAGLMVGRSPEYLGKKIEAVEIKWALLGILAPGAVILIGAGISCVLPVALSSLLSKGPHGLSEILYAFTSAAGNNGSAFAGLNANTPYYNLILAFAMFVGRFAVIVPCLAIGGSLVAKKISPPTAGTFPTDSLVFGFLLTGVIVIVGALTFLPALSLGPIVEQLMMVQGHTF